MESLSQENRKFNPDPQFVKQAKIAGMDAYRVADPYHGSHRLLAGWWMQKHRHWADPISKPLGVYI